MNPCVPHTMASRTLDPRQPELPQPLQALLRASGSVAVYGFRWREGMLALSQGFLAILSRVRAHGAL